MSESAPKLDGRADIPDTCPDCGADYERTWINNARPLGTLYRIFQHQNDAGDRHDQCFVTIDGSVPIRSVSHE